MNDISWITSPHSASPSVLLTFDCSESSQGRKLAAERCDFVAVSMLLYWLRLYGVVWSSEYVTCCYSGLLIAGGVIQCHTRGLTLWHTELTEGDIYFFFM